MKALEFYNEIICNTLSSFEVRDQAIVGGYARDKYYGLTPKDMDICIVPTSVHTIGTILSLLTQLGINYEYFECYDSKSHQQFKEMLYGVVRVFCDDMPVDILVSKLDSVQEYIDAFDYNLNQYKMLPTGTSLYFGLPDLNPEKCLQLVNLRRDTVDARKVKMRKKWEVMYNIIIGKE